MKWNFRKIIIAAAAAMLAGSFCTAAAQGGLSSEEIEIINEIVKAKIKETNGIDTVPKIEKAIDAIYPVTEKDTPEAAAFVKQLEEQARMKFPATDKELEKKYRALAETKYPLYKAGENVTVIFRLYGKKYTVSGRYYRQDPQFVWVGSKKILKTNLSEDYVARFDPALTKKLQMEFIEQEVRNYRQEREALFTALKTKNGEKIFELRGGLPSYRKKMAAQKAAQQKYQNELDARKEIDNVVNMYTGNKQEAYKKMKLAVKQYTGTISAEKGKKLLIEWKLESLTEMFRHDDKKKAIGELDKFVKGHADIPEAEKGKKLLVKWKLESLTEMFRHGDKKKALDEMDKFVKEYAAKPVTIHAEPAAEGEAAEAGLFPVTGSPPRHATPAAAAGLNNRIFMTAGD